MYGSKPGEKGFFADFSCAISGQLRVKGEFIPCIYPEKAECRDFPAFAVAQLPSGQNNVYIKEAFWCFFGFPMNILVSLTSNKNNRKAFWVQGATHVKALGLFSIIQRQKMDL